MVSQIHHQNSIKQITWQDVCNSFNLVWKEVVQRDLLSSDVDVCATKRVLHSKLNKYFKRIKHNISAIQNTVSKKDWLKKVHFDHIDDLIANLGNDEYLKECYNHYYDDPPGTLFKYVSCKHALSSVLNHHFHCGKAADYQKTDPNDSIPLLDYGDTSDNVGIYELILGNVIYDLLQKQDIDLDTTKRSINTDICKLYYIGCLSDSSDNEYLWDTYGKDGVCLEFDVSDMNVHKITYSDMPVDSKYVTRELCRLADAITTKTAAEVKRQFEELSKFMASMGLLNLYRKDTQYQKESEWRLLVEPGKLKKDKDNYFMEAKLVRVISDLPDDQDAELRNYCEQNHIPYGRRKHPVE